jgi:hypothetical protein
MKKLSAKLICLLTLAACGLPAEPLEESEVEQSTAAVENPVQPLDPYHPPDMPSCATFNHSTDWDSQAVIVCNAWCSRPLTFKVRREGPDSECLSVRPEACRVYKWSIRDELYGTTFGCR